MRVLFLLLALTGCRSSVPTRPTIQRLPVHPVSVAATPVLDPGGAPSSLSDSREVVLDGTSIVGRWEAIVVADDPAATEDIRLGTLAKTLVINPTGRVTLRGRDARQAAGTPVAFTGAIQDATLRLDELPGAATLWLRESRLHVLDPGGTITIYIWRGR